MASILIVNSQDPKCGVHNFGLSFFNIVKKSSRHSYTHHIFQSVEELKNIAPWFDLIIFNYHEKLFPWLSDSLVLELKTPCVAITGHDCDPAFESLKHIINCDSTGEKTSRSTPIPRPVRNFQPLPDPEIVTIGSCGFGFYSKNFQHVADIVAECFDEAIIRLHIPQHPHGDSVDSIISTIREQLWNLNRPKIKIQVLTEFLSDEDLVAFLSGNTANVFLYPPFSGEKRGLSSTIDKALAAKKPIAISDSQMYRHINHEEKFLLSKYSLAQIIDFGTEHIKPFWEQHSEKNLIEAVDSIVDKVV